MKKVLLTLAVLIPYILFAQTNINMPSGSNTATHTTCNARFYDTGGLNGNHGINQNSSIKFAPATAGLAIRIQFNIFHTLLFIILYNGSNFFTCFNNLINILL